MTTIKRGQVTTIERYQVTMADSLGETLDTRAGEALIHTISYSWPLPPIKTTRLIDLATGEITELPIAGAAAFVP